MSWNSGVVLFWSGFYIFLSWFFFIWIPTLLTRLFLNKFKFGKFIFLMSPIMGLYAALIYSLLLGHSLNWGETYFFFLPYAIYTGLTYGLVFTTLTITEKATQFILAFVLILGIGFYFLFPKLLPSHAFRYMPERTQEKIVSRVIPTLKVGDPFELFLNKLPYHNTQLGTYRNSSILPSKEKDAPKNFRGSLNYSNEFISYKIVYKNGVITKLEYDLK